MARIQVIEEANATGSIKATYDGLQQRLGFVPNMPKLFSLWPEVFELNQKLFETVMFAESELPNPTKEMIALVVSKANSCNYCVGHHSNFLHQYGVSEDLVHQLRADASQPAVDDQLAVDQPAVDQKTGKLLEYARKVTQHAFKVTDEDVEALRQSGWSDRQILEATVVAGQFNSINRVVDALGAEFEPVMLESQWTSSTNAETQQQAAA